MGRPGLGDDERRRLRAHFTRVTADPPSPASLRKHVSLLPADLRQEAGDLLLAVALADGSIDRAEVTRVNRYFDALGLDRPELGSQPASRRRQGSLTPVRTAGAPSPGYAIPQPPPAGEAQGRSGRPGSRADQGPAGRDRAGRDPSWPGSSPARTRRPSPRCHATAAPQGAPSRRLQARCPGDSMQRTAPSWPGSRSGQLAAQRGRQHRGRAGPDARRGARDRERGRLRARRRAGVPRAATRLKSTADVVKEILR